jgi:hypothetical protein
LGESFRIGQKQYVPRHTFHGLICVGVWQPVLLPGIMNGGMESGVGVRSEQMKGLRYVILVLSLFVFLFALRAKVSQYPQSGTVHPEASKLWLNGQKMELGTSVESSQNILLGMLAVILLFSSPPVRGSRATEFSSDVVVHPSTDLFQLHRFLRPPPAR